MRLPLPIPETVNQPFWDALKDGRLLVQRCPTCSILQHPPREMCPRCHATELEWTPLAGTGTIYSYIVSHQAIHPTLVDKVPFATVMVLLDEGVRMVSNVIDVDPMNIEIGMPVRFVAVTDDDGVVLPQFQAASS